MEDKIEQLKSVKIFSNLDNENLKKLEDISIIKTYDSGEIVFYEGEQPYYLHILLDGVMRMYKTDNKGHQLYIHQFIPISFVAELANFENIPYPASGEFVTTGKILKIDYAKLETNFFKNPDISFEIIKSLSKKVKILSNVIHKEMILNSDAKTAKLLIENKELFLAIKNTQIASILNITPETLSRTLKKFKTQNFIDFDTKHDIIILDEQSLRALYE